MCRVLVFAIFALVVAARSMGQMVSYAPIEVPYQSVWVNVQESDGVGMPSGTYTGTWDSDGSAFVLDDPAGSWLGTYGAGRWAFVDATNGGQVEFRSAGFYGLQIDEHDSASGLDWTATPIAPEPAGLGVLLCSGVLLLRRGRRCAR